MAMFLVAISMFLWSNVRVTPARSSTPNSEMSVRLPLAIQVALAGGDRYLAADLSGFRVLVADVFRMSRDQFATQAQVQRDISWLNPAHQDNYYIAAAILSEPELIPAAQYILRRAADARPYDWQPLFYFGFNLYHFEKNPIAGANALLEAVPRIKEQGDSWTMQTLAARWLERGYAAADAARLVEGMAENATPGPFQRYLRSRFQRLRDLAGLKELAKVYREKYGRSLTKLDDLITAGLIEKIPPDPLHIGYVLDRNGDPAFASAR
jgi:hypothetical protein